MSVKSIVLSSICVLTMLVANVGVASEGSEKPALTVESLTFQALPAEWWRVLDGDVTPLSARIDVLLALANQHYVLLPLEEQSSLNNLWESIKANAQALQTLRAKKIQQTVKPAALLEKYDLDAWQEALQTLRKEKDQLEIAKSALQQAEAQRDAIGREADDATAQYLSHSNSDAHKTSLALDMFDKRLAWLVAMESDRLYKDQLSAQAQKLSFVESVWKAANERFWVGPDDIKQLKSTILSQKQLVEKMIDVVRAAQADAVVIWGEDELSRAKGLAQHVLVTKANVDQALAQSQLLWRQQSLVFARLHLASEQVDLDKDVRDQLVGWAEAIDHLTQQRKQWRGVLEAQREQVQTNLLMLVETPPSDMSTKQIAQVKQLYQQAQQGIAQALTGLKTLHAQVDDLDVLLDVLRHWLLDAEGVWASRWHEVVGEAKQFVSFTGDLLTASLFKVGDTPVTTLGIIRMFIFITLAWWLSFWLRKGLAQISSHNDKIAPHTAYTLGRLIHYVVMIIGLVVALSSVGIDFSNVAWIAGALSVGIGFGLQAVVNNFVSGLIVMFERTLKVGDFIELPSGVSGTVKEIRLRSTLITTGDNLEIVVPNAEFMTGRVVNWTLSDLYRRVHVPFSVALGSDKREVVSAVLAAASMVPYTLQDHGRAPQVVLNSLEGKMVFELLVWIKQGSVKHNYGVKASYLWQIETALRDKSIELV